MPTLLNTGTRDIPLQFAKQLTDLVNQEWEQGSFINKVSPITQDLLRFWFSPAFSDERRINFHEGQKQAILNAIYCHEVLKTESVFNMYQVASNNIMDDKFLFNSDEEFEFTKFSVGYQITWLREWSRVDDNPLKDYLLPLLLSRSFNLRKYLLKNGKDQQGYKSFLNVIQEIVEPLSERVQKDYADSYKDEKPLRMLVDYASSAT